MKFKNFIGGGYLKNNKKILFLLIIGVVLIIGTSLAYIRFERIQENPNKIAALCLDMEFIEDKNSNINLEKAYPIPDKEGSGLTPYTFTIKNKCNDAVNYEINLDIIEEENAIDISHIKTKLNEEEPVILESLNTSEKTIREATISKELKVSTLRGKESITYSLRLWMDYDTSIEEGSNKTFKSKVVVKGTSTSIPNMNNDVYFAVYLDNKKVDKMPSRGAYTVSVTCDKDSSGFWDYNNWGAVVTNINTGTSCEIDFTSGKYLSDYIIDASKTDKQIKQITEPETEQTGANATEEYRYVGESAKVNNWVYFGCDSDCTEDNLYRIIGVIPTQSIIGGTYEKRVKLIKATRYIDETSVSSSVAIDGKGYTYSGTSGHTNNWAVSTLQSNTLNTIYWNSLGEYQKYIDPTVWYLGSHKDSGVTVNLKSIDLYKYERGSTRGISQGPLSFQAYIGLMYPSDYGYSIDDYYWDTSIYTNSAHYISSAWLYVNSKKNGEWTISPESSQNDISAGGSVVSYAISKNGTVYGGYTYGYSDHFFSIRPTFNLKTNVMYKSGTGTSSDPYRIMIN